MLGGRIGSMVVWVLLSSEVARSFTARSSRAVQNKGAGRPLCALQAQKSDEVGNGGLRILEWIPSQQLLVTTAKTLWKFAWKTMMTELAPQSPDGDYVRPNPQRGAASTTPQLVAEEGRYGLYIGNACPWCHRTTLGVAMRSLEKVVKIFELDADPTKARRGGWSLGRVDEVFGCEDLKGVYDVAAPDYQGRCTAPLLVDLKTKKIVSNESADILRALAMLRGDLANDVDLYPSDLASEIDAINDWVYDLVNNGVYRCGFATTQEAYERAEADVHVGLSRCETILSKTRFLTGDSLTEADLRLLPTVERFDICYAGLFRCGRKTVRCDYPAIHRWRADLRSLPGVSSTIDLKAAAASYYETLFPLNPSAIIPVPPQFEEAEIVLGTAEPPTRTFSSTEER